MLERFCSLLNPTKTLLKIDVSLAAAVVLEIGAALGQFFQGTIDQMSKLKFRLMASEAKDTRSSPISFTFKFLEVGFNTKPKKLKANIHSQNRSKRI